MLCNVLPENPVFSRLGPNRRTFLRSHCSGAVLSGCAQRLCSAGLRSAAVLSGCAKGRDPQCRCPTLLRIRNRGSGDARPLCAAGLGSESGSMAPAPSSYLHGGRGASRSVQTLRPSKTIPSKGYSIQSRRGRESLGREFIVPRFPWTHGGQTELNPSLGWEVFRPLGGDFLGRAVDGWLDSRARANPVRWTGRGFPGTGLPWTAISGTGFSWAVRGSSLDGIWDSLYGHYVTRRIPFYVDSLDRNPLGWTGILLDGNRLDKDVLDLAGDPWTEIFEDGRWRYRARRLRLKPPSCDPLSEFSRSGVVPSGIIRSASDLHESGDIVLNPLEPRWAHPAPSKAAVEARNCVCRTNRSETKYSRVEKEPDSEKRNIVPATALDTQRRRHHRTRHVRSGVLPFCLTRAVQEGRTTRGSKLQHSHELALRDPEGGMHGLCGNAFGRHGMGHVDDVQNAVPALIKNSEERERKVERTVMEPRTVVDVVKVPVPVTRMVDHPELQHETVMVPREQSLRKDGLFRRGFEEKSCSAMAGLFSGVTAREQRSTEMVPTVHKETVQVPKIEARTRMVERVIMVPKTITVPEEYHEQVMVSEAAARLGPRPCALSRRGDPGGRFRPSIRAGSNVSAGDRSAPPRRGAREDRHGAAGARRHGDGARGAREDRDGPAPGDGDGRGGAGDPADRDGAADGGRHRHGGAAGPADGDGPRGALRAVHGVEGHRVDAAGAEDGDGDGARDGAGAPHGDGAAVRRGPLRGDARPALRPEHRRADHGRRRRGEEVGGRAEHHRVSGAGRQSTD
eukprot:gene17564-biopygen13688